MSWFPQYSKLPNHLAAWVSICSCLSIWSLLVISIPKIRIKYEIVDSFRTKIMMAVSGDPLFPYILLK